MSTVQISIKTNSADTSAFTKLGHKSLQNIDNLIKGIKSGSVIGSANISVSSSDPVAATGTITCASVADADTVTIGKTTLTAKTSPSGSAQWARGGTNTVDAAALVACINAHAVLSLLVSAANVLGVVTITSLSKSSLANHIALASSDNSTLAKSATYLSGGTGGAESAQLTFAR